MIVTTILLCWVAGLLDIPVHKSRIQSLHLLFTLFSEFKNSQVIFGRCRFKLAIVIDCHHRQCALGPHFRNFL